MEQKSCNGHWGFIPLELPCFHIGFLGFTLEILNSVCKVALVPHLFLLPAFTH